jgi:uncharacterized protein (DUF2062 family)
MGRVSDWLRRKVRDPLVAELRQGATPEAVAAAVTVSLAIAINPIIGTTTVGCLLAGRLFRLNHVVMQVINHTSYPLQILLIVPFVRLGETVTGAEHLPLSPSAIVDEFGRSFGGFLQKFGMAYVHGIIGWLIVVPASAWILNLVLRSVFRRVLPKSAAP